VKVVLALAAFFIIITLGNLSLISNLVVSVLVVAAGGALVDKALM
jgi:hypothetical protein